MELLRVSNIEKSFGTNHVLKGVSLSVSKNEVVSIIGRSGSGKSTLLRCATLLERVSAGSIFIDGEAMVEDGHYAPKASLARIRRRLGLVFQDFNLFPHFSVLRNVMEAQTVVLGKTQDEAKKTALDLLEKMGIADKANEYPFALSGGQCQRVAIARALALSPDVLFFDEPTSALDPQLTQEVLKVIRKLADEHMTMVIVTHEMAFARDISDRVVFMDRGVVAASGKPSDRSAGSKNTRLQEFLGDFQ